MAVVAATKVYPDIPVGEGRVIQTWRTSALGTAAADEWIATDLDSIDEIIGSAIIGATASTVPPAFMKNARGTGVAEGTNLGDIGIESTDAGINLIAVTVIGIPSSYPATRR